MFRHLSTIVRSPGEVGTFSLENINLTVWLNRHPVARRQTLSGFCGVPSSTDLGGNALGTALRASVMGQGPGINDFNIACPSSPHPNAQLTNSQNQLTNRGSEDHGR